MPTKKKEELNNEELKEETKKTAKVEVSIKEIEKELTETEKRIMFYKKKAALRQKMLDYKLIVDGYNDQQHYEYAKAEQYRNILSKFCLEVGLDYHLSGVNCIFENMIKSDKMMMTTVIVDVHLIDPETGFEEVSRQFAQGSDNLDKGLYKGNTMILKEYVRNEFGMSLDNDKGVDCEAPVEMVKETKTNRFVTPEKKSELAKAVVNKTQEEMDKLYAVANGESKEENVELSTPEFIQTAIKLMDEVRAIIPDWGTTTYDNLTKAIETNTMPKQIDVVKKMQSIEKKHNEVCGG